MADDRIGKVCDAIEALLRSDEGIQAEIDHANHRYSRRGRSKSRVFVEIDWWPEAQVLAYQLDMLRPNWWKKADG